MSKRKELSDEESDMPALSRSSRVRAQQAAKKPRVDESEEQDSEDEQEARVVKRSKSSHQKSGGRRQAVMDDDVDDEANDDDDDDDEEEEEDEDEEEEEVQARPAKHQAKKLKQEKPTKKQQSKSTKSSANGNNTAEHAGNDDDDGDDGGGGDDDDEEEINNGDDVEELKRMRQSQEDALKIKGSAEIGIILCVEVQNFMCHRYLQMELGPHVNFITGQNGSGKSAILCALVVGLGGDAKFTGRGNSTKGFIKGNESFALIRIHLKNVGPDAYRHEDYGDVILVERRINRESAGGYKLKNGKTERVVSTLKDELNNILDAFSIQVANPFALLTQDTSREFLTSATPKKLYEYFSKATELDRMSADYSGITAVKDSIKFTLDTKGATIGKMQAEVERLKERYEDLKEINNMQLRVEELKKELVWALIREQEKVGGDLQKSVKKIESQLSALESRLAEAKKTEAEAVGDVQRFQARMNESAQTSETITNRLQQKKKELDAARKKAADVSNRISNVSESASKTRAQIRKIQGRIDEERRRISVDSGEKAAKVNAQIEKLSQERDSLLSSLNQNKNRSTMLEERRRDMISENQKVQDELAQLGRSISSLTRSLEMAKAAQKDRIKAFGAGMPNVLQEIRREKRFSKEPVGPLGYYMELSDQKWAKAVESCIKELTTAFAVHSYDDQKILQDIFKRCLHGAKFPLIIVRPFVDKVFEVHDLPDRRFTSILDVVRSQHPMVINTCLDQNQIHKVLLFQTSEEATGVMFSDREFPRNVLRGFDIEGNTYEGGRSTAQYINKYSGNLKLVASSDEQIQSLQAQLDRQIASQRQLNSTQQQLRSETEKLHREINDIQSRGMRDNSRIQRIASDISDLQSSLQEEESTIDVMELERSKQSMEEELAVYTEQIDTLKGELEAAKQLCAPIEDEYKAMTEESRRVIAETESIDSDILAAGGKVTKAAHDVRALESKKREFLVTLENESNALRAATEKLESERAKALEYCERVDTHRASKDIQSEISTKLKRIQQEERNRGRFDDIEKEYQEKLNQFTSTVKQYDGLRRVVARFEQMLAVRRFAFACFRKSIALRSKFYFVALLSRRGFEGKLKFKVKRAELEIIVNPRSSTSEQTGARKDTSSLSGGERSYSTVCFLASLWAAIDCPFRILDEFDVFMDQVNRKISMKMLVDIATTEQGQRQHIFITPQSIDATMLGNKTKILCMPNPDRFNVQ